MNEVQLRRDIRRFFRRNVAARVSMPKSSGNLYELYVYSLVCEAITAAGCSLQVEGPQTGAFAFRCSPGPIGGQFNYHSFTGRSGQKYQLRNGIEIYGHSQMRHESDIAIFRLDSGRAEPLGEHSEIVLSIECKCYSSAASLKGEARKNAGMVQDWSKESHPSRSSGTPQGCIHCGLGFVSKFVTNVRKGTRLDIERYFTAYDLGPEFGILSGAPETNSFRSDLTNYIASL